jgi:hypothetical protein
MEKVFNSESISGISDNKLKLMKCIIEYQNGVLINNDNGIYLRLYFMEHAKVHLQQYPSQEFSKLLDKYTNNLNAQYDVDDNMTLFLFFIQHCDSNGLEKVNLNYILITLKQTDITTNIPTIEEIQNYSGILKLTNDQRAALESIVMKINDLLCLKQDKNPFSVIFI